MTLETENELVMELRIQVRNRAGKSGIYATTGQEKINHEKDEKWRAPKEQNTPRGKQIIEEGRGKKRTRKNRGYQVTATPHAEQSGTKKAKTEAQTEGD